MIREIPFYINLLFIFTTLLTFYFLWVAANKSRLILIVGCAWLILQGFLGFSDFYRDFSIVPPRFMLLILPPVVSIVALFLTKKGKLFLDSLDHSKLTLLHSVRIPVELSLFALFTYAAVPELMTFEGRNLDILSGITAPLVFYFAFVKKKIGKMGLIAWNFICLALLFNIVTHAILAAPFPFQKIAFEQPNVAVFYFPFVWLPGFVVPAVLLSHLASLRQLLKNRTYDIPDLLEYH